MVSICEILTENEGEWGQISVKPNNIRTKNILLIQKIKSWCIVHKNTSNLKTRVGVVKLFLLSYDFFVLIVDGKLAGRAKEI